MAQQGVCEHIVLLKWKPGVTEEQIQQVMAQVRSLKEIDGVLDISTGKNFCSRNKGFDFGLVVRFRSKEAQEAYQKDQRHVDVVAKHIKPVIDDVIAVDYIDDTKYSSGVPCHPILYYGGFVALAVGAFLGGMLWGGRAQQNNTATTLPRFVYNTK